MIPVGKVRLRWSGIGYLRWCCKTVARTLQGFEFGNALVALREFGLQSVNLAMGLDKASDKLHQRGVHYAISQAAFTARIWVFANVTAGAPPR